MASLQYALSVNELKARGVSSLREEYDKIIAKEHDLAHRARQRYSR